MRRTPRRRTSRRTTPVPPDLRLRWVIDILWIDRDGRQRRYRRDARVQSREGALLEARELQQRALKFGTLDTKDPLPTFGAFVDGAFKTTIMPRFRKATRVRYKALFGQGVLDHFGGLRLDDVADGVLPFAALLAERKVQSKGALTLVKTVLRSAVELGFLESMPHVPRVWKDSRKLPDSPPVEDVELLLAHADGWLLVAIALAAYAGLRSGEVRALEVADIDLRAGLIIVRRAFSEDEVTTPKSTHERVIPIASPLMPIVERAVRAKLPKARVVVTSTGSTPTRQNILARLNEFEDRLGMKRWSFHQLRHFFCSRLVALGANLEAVRIMAGHSGLSITQKYVHAQARDLAAAIGRFGGSTGN